MAFIDAWSEGVSLAGRGTDEFRIGAVREEGVGVMEGYIGDM